MSQLCQETERPSVTDDILRLKKERNAVVLAHNYQIPGVQEVADFLGGSLGLSQAAAKTRADVIVFCGVHFMAETASILCPNKKVLIPALQAGCSLADTINVKQLREWKKKHPKSLVVSYVNTSAEVKAESDYCCTSGNVVKMMEAIPKEREILFLPDFFLGAFAKARLARKIHVWPGECYVHASILPEDIEGMMKKHQGAEFLIHPECGCIPQYVRYLAQDDVTSKNVHILSTEGMIRHAHQSRAKKFIVATEVGILHRMGRENPEKSFYAVREDAVCKYMKMITLENVYRSLRDLVYEVRVEEAIAKKARIPIQRMLQLV
jgi:quinolinate synthase